MKRQILVLVIGLLFIGSNILAADGDLIVNGNVGIGTSTPTAKLDVNGTIAVGSISTRTSNIELNSINTGNRYAYIDFHGDDTYTDYALRLIRYNTGPNAYSILEHRGTGGLVLRTDEAAPIVFHTSASERMRVQPDGNVGIGTAAPAEKLDISGNLKLSGYFDDGQKVYTRTYTVNTTTSATLLGSDGNPLALEHAYLVEGYVEGTSNSTGAKAVIWNDLNGSRFITKIYEASKTANGVEFYLDTNVPKVRLYNHTQLYTVRVKITETNSIVRSPAPFDLGNIYQDGSTSGVGIGTDDPGSYKLYVNGTAYSTGGWQSSDVRYKDNVTPIGSPLNKILSIEGISFDWKRDEFREKGFPEGRHYGVIAQDVERVLPEVVKEGPGGEKSVSYTEIVPVLIEAMKEQQKEIERLKMEVTKLRIRN